MLCHCSFFTSSLWSFSFIADRRLYLRLCLVPPILIVTSMERTMMKNTTPNLPLDIISNILVRLPVKSLIRFQCVCKDWKNLFRTPLFIAEHLNHSSRQNPLLVIDYLVSEGSPWHLCLLNQEMQFSEFPHTDVIDPLTRGRVHSSNGLLCVEIGSEPQRSLCLWNPSIRAVRQVPESPNNYDYSDLKIGFGFSSIANDYKIVKLLLSKSGTVVQGEVYSLRTGLWRNVEVGNLEGMYVSHGFPCNEAIFWRGEKVYGNWHFEMQGEKIISFDIASEVFTYVPFPSHMSPYECLESVASYENKLAIFYRIYIEDSELYVVEAWVLEDFTDGEGWSWTKIYTSSPYAGVALTVVPAFIWRNEIVCHVDLSPVDRIQARVGSHEQTIGLFNLSTDECNTFQTPKCCNLRELLDYVESLVLLD